MTISSGTWDVIRSVAPSHRFRPFGTSLPRQMVSRVAELEAKVNVHWERRGCAL